MVILFAPGKEALRARAACKTPANREGGGEQPLLAPAKVALSAAARLRSAPARFGGARAPKTAKHSPRPQEKRLCRRARLAKALQTESEAANNHY